MLMNWNYRRVARAAGITIDYKKGDDMKNFPIEKARLDCTWYLLGVWFLTVICYGWVLEKETSLAGPLVLLFVMGITMTGTFNMLSTLLVDLYPMSPATVTAANNLVRCVFGAGGLAVVEPMLKAMGRGWCYTFIALVCLAFSPTAMG